MKLKKLLVIAMVGVMGTLLLTGCGGEKASKGKGSGESEDKKVVKVGLEAQYPPFEYMDEDGKTIIGIDAELAKEIGKELGYEIEFVNTNWDGIFAGLDKGDYDLIMSAITITPERVEKYSFSTPYVKNYQCVVTLKDAKTKPKSLDEMKGLEVGYQEESTSDVYFTDYVDSKGIKCSVNEYNKIIDAFSDLETGRLEAIVCDSTVADQYVAGGNCEITWKQEDEPEEFGICFPKNSEYVEEFDTALKKLQKNGTVDKIFAKYFAENATVSE